MRLNEFEELNLAINYHDELNQALWEGTRMRPEVRKALMRIANDFKRFLGIDLFDLMDITISGSNAAYTYTPQSDIDLHLVVMIPDDHEQELKELFKAKKYEYNDIHNIKIRGFDVELYVQDAEDPHHSMGIFSVLHNKWLSIPKKQRAKIDDIEVKEKYECMKHRINQSIVDDSHERISAVWASIKQLRKSGLERGGEFSPENLAFKILRADGTLEKLYRHMGNVEDQGLGLDEALDQDLNEDNEYQKNKDVIEHFVDWVYEKENINAPRPEIIFADDKEYPGQHNTGSYNWEDNTIWVYTDNRNLVDILRTLAHELRHRKQGAEGRIKGHSSPGSKLEREADGEAGYLIKLYAAEHPGIIQ